MILIKSVNGYYVTGFNIGKKKAILLIRRLIGVVEDTAFNRKRYYKLKLFKSLNLISQIDIMLK